jgi:hypothetical protein
MADDGSHQFPLVTRFTPPIDIIEGEQYMPLFDVLQILQPGGHYTGKTAHSILTNFKALAPRRSDKQWSRVAVPDTRIKLVRERSVEACENFSTIEDNQIEHLYINVGWAKRIIEASRRKGVEAASERRPWNYMLGKSPWVARVVTADPDVFFYM